MDAAQATGAEDLDASQVGEEHGARDGGAPVEALVGEAHATDVAEVASGQLERVGLTSGRGQLDELFGVHADTGYAVEYANRGWYAAIASDNAFEERGECDVVGVGEAWEQGE